MHRTAYELRETIRDLVAESISLHRSSRELADEQAYQAPHGLPTDSEINAFLFSNVLLDDETVEQLCDPGLLGFHAKTAEVTSTWLREFQQRISEWAETNAWLGADPPLRAFEFSYTPTSSQLWQPAKEPQPSWLSASPSALMLAQTLLAEGKLLSELSWQAFEDLIAALLEKDSWKIDGLVRTKDGGVDVIAVKDDLVLGAIKSLWQAKKYSPTNKVRLAQLRELSGVLARDGATKGIVVTTSSLTRGALDWIKQDQYHLSYKDKGGVEAWVRRVVLK